MSLLGITWETFPKNVPSISLMTVLRSPAQNITPQPPNQPSLPAGSGNLNSLFLLLLISCEVEIEVGANNSFCSPVNITKFVEQSRLLN